MSEIDPIQYGAMIAKVEALERTVESMTTKVDQLLELANRSKGGFWMGMTIASSAGAAVAWITSHMPWTIQR